MADGDLRERKQVAVCKQKAESTVVKDTPIQPKVQEKSVEEDKKVRQKKNKMSIMANETENFQALARSTQPFIFEREYDNFNTFKLAKHALNEKNGRYNSNAMENWNRSVIDMNTNKNEY